MRGARLMSGRSLARILRNTLCLSSLIAPMAIGSGQSLDAVRYSDSGPEPMLEQVFRQIERNRVELALDQVDALLQIWPNFRLGHLIRGDLLLARSSALTTIGNAPNAPQDVLTGLRDEAVARIRAYRDKPPVDGVPRYLMQLPADQKHAVVVDARRSRLYLYENVDGRPRFVADYYVSHGRLGIEKLREGDKKTPLGVYQVTGFLPPERLTDFYGAGALPINYPNAWDRKQGRKGHGIWLHGTPSDTFSRPPRASDGCVVLANPDFLALNQYLRGAAAPVIISDSVEWLSLDDWHKERKEFNRVLEQWRVDWESRDSDRYLSHYSPQFSASGTDFQEFARHKRAVNASKKWVKVGIRNLSTYRNPGRDHLVVVTFEQDYRSDTLSNIMRKQQYWQKEDGHWRIVFEGEA
ncbi:MAG: L,D-transpeptidase family protein [Methyloversatilis sp.]|nr:L,D-transpeptidase family protein [Methyloversatilis sp.]MBP6195543.1 L,D-transpeptidase family protein [Methyloversatilis sp.]MBP9118960.1 L,D-transpeptidase family protein [Methyloversatilis sp.]